MSGGDDLEGVDDVELELHVRLLSQAEVTGTRIMLLRAPSAQAKILDHRPPRSMIPLPYFEESVEPGRARAPVRGQRGWDHQC